MSNIPPDEVVKRLGFTFHRTFFLKRSAVKQVLELVEAGSQSTDKKQGLGRQEIRDKSHLGTIYVEAMPRWAWGAGILTSNNTLTKFGEFVQKYDLSMEYSCTQWLMHYHLSAVHGPGPSFWYEITSTRFRSGETFTQGEIAKQIGEIYLKEEGKALSSGSATSTANAFLKTYTNSDGLGNLGLLREVGNNTFVVEETELPSTWTVALAILDYWKANFPNQVTVNLTSLNTDSGLASLFMMSKSRLDMVLSEMREIGMVELFRVAPPYQVALLNNNPELIFQRMYNHDFPS